MNDRGYVYVLMNPSMEDLVKIGKSTKNPSLRAKELSSTTGVPTPFVVAYHCYFESCTNAERFVHSFLEEKGYRVSQNREFFKIPIKDAIDAIITAKNYFDKLQKANPKNDIYKNELLIEKKHRKDPEQWSEVFEIAEIYYHGKNDKKRNYEEAYKYYKKAMELGSLESYCRLGIMCRDGKGVIEDRYMASQYFKEGAKKGNTSCHAELAYLYDYHDKIEKALVSWNNYFESTTKKIDINYGESYIDFVVNNDLELKYKEKLLVVKDEILELLYDYIASLEFENADFLVNRYKKTVDFIKSELVGLSDYDSTIDKTDSKESAKPKSKWKKLFE